MSNDELVDELKIYLEDNNITQREFADMMDVSDISVSRWIHGQRTIGSKYVKAIKTIIGKDTRESTLEPTTGMVDVIKYIQTLSKSQKKELIRIILDMI